MHLKIGKMVLRGGDGGGVGCGGGGGLLGIGKWTHYCENNLAPRGCLPLPLAKSMYVVMYIYFKHLR